LDKRQLAVAVAVLTLAVPQIKTVGLVGLAVAVQAITALKVFLLALVVQALLVKVTPEATDRIEAVLPS
jgi:hypothetical protein